MRNVRPAFERWDGTLEDATVGKKLVGYQRINCHMVFDIKMDNLTRKARFVARGYTTDTPSSITYSSVVSRDSVRIAFLLASLNNCDVCVADIHIAAALNRGFLHSEFSLRLTLNLE
jgi:AhpD family alkylhydroperoxidase